MILLTLVLSLACLLVLELDFAVIHPDAVQVLAETLRVVLGLSHHCNLPAQPREGLQHLPCVLFAGPQPVAGDEVGDLLVQIVRGWLRADVEDSRRLVVVPTLMIMCQDSTRAPKLLATKSSGSRGCVEVRGCAWCEGHTYD